jgi:hypothetical protein
VATQRKSFEPKRKIKSIRECNGEESLKNAKQESAKIQWEEE